MKTYTLADLRSTNPKPCYDPNRYLAEDWTGTLMDILRVEECPAEDRVWIVCLLLDERTARLFAVWCARQVLALVAKPDPRIMAVCDVAERHTYGQASNEELAAARRTARAAWAAKKRGFPRYAWAAAWDATKAFAWDAAWVARYAARWYSARDISFEEQIARLIKMIEEDAVGK